VEVNTDRIKLLPNRGPDAKYTLSPEIDALENIGVTLELLGEPVGGLACKLDSLGFKVLCDATKKVDTTTTLTFYVILNAASFLMRINALLEKKSDG
jgi:hypothetical protein